MDKSVDTSAFKLHESLVAVLNSFTQELVGMDKDTQDILNAIAVVFSRIWWDAIRIAAVDNVPSGKLEEMAVSMLARALHHVIKTTAMIEEMTKQ